MPTNKQELLQKYYTKHQPGMDGQYDLNHIRRNWRRDQGTKLPQAALEALLKQVN